MHKTYTQSMGSSRLLLSGFAGTYRVSGAFTPGRNYSLQIHAGLRAESGNRRLTDTLEQVFYLPDAEAAIRIPYEGRFLSSHGNRLLPLESVNVREFTVVAARLPAHNLEKQVLAASVPLTAHFGSCAGPAPGRVFSTEIRKS